MSKKESKFRYFALRIGLMFASCYVALVLIEIGSFLGSDPQQLQFWKMVKFDQDAGYALKPNTVGHFDDGFAKGEVRVNSLGYRDDETRKEVKKRILLLGDSFTFGALLDQSETIDKQLELLMPEMEASNLGVKGYNLPQQLVPLRRWKFPANEVVYLFYPNDLYITLGSDFKDMDGSVLRRFRPDGTEYRDSELRQILAQGKSRRNQSSSAFHVFLVPNVRQSFKRFLSKANKFVVKIDDNESLPDGLVNNNQRNEEIAKAVEYTKEMNEISKARNMGFSVVIIPQKKDVESGRYGAAIEIYVKELKENDIPVVELLDKLSTKDFWQHDGHFNPRGAKTTAEIIRKALETQH